MSQKEVPLKIIPRTLNCRSKGNWVKAQLTLSEAIMVADVDPDRPAVLHSLGFASAPVEVFVNEDERVEIEAAFAREDLCSLAGDWPQALTVAGLLADGDTFLGTSSVRTITPGRADVVDLSNYWLQEVCEKSSFCDGG